MKTSKRKFIGVFDSGFGGLSILKDIVQTLPQYDYLYLGDTGRAPYGDRTQEVIYEFTQQAVDFLFKKGCELIVLACNTAASEALRKIQREYLPKHYPKRRVLGVLIPAAEAAAAKTKNKRVGVVATQSTVSSGGFPAEIQKLDSQIKVFQKACPLLVPLVEFGEERSKAAEFLVKKYLTPFHQKKIDTLILGCTHYEMMLPMIKKALKGSVKIVAEAPIVSEKLKDYLARHPEIEKKLSRQHTVDFYSTDLTPRFQSLGSRFFGKKIHAKKAILK